MKWWLLALPHYLVIAVVTGAFTTADVQAPGLNAVLVLARARALRGDGGRERLGQLVGPRPDRAPVTGVARVQVVAERERQRRGVHDAAEDGDGDRLQGRLVGERPVELLTRSPDVIRIERQRAMA